MLVKRGMGFLVLISLQACSTPGAFTYRSPGFYYGGSPLGAGTYLEEVSLATKGSESFRFRCHFQRKSGLSSVLVSCLSTKGLTIFRVLDPLESIIPPEIRFPPSELENKREQLTAFYLGFRSLFLLDEKPPRFDPMVHERYSDGRPRLVVPFPGTELIVDEYDWNGHAFRLTLMGPGFVAKISLREYEPSGSSEGT